MQASSVNRMQHATFLGERRTEVRDGLIPQPQAGDVLLLVLRTALCGSDTKLWTKGSAYVPGHEIFGCVKAPGHVLDERRCLVYMPTHCGHCQACVAGDTQLCLTQSNLIGWNRDGGYAQYVCVPENCLMPVPDDIPDRLAPLLLDTIGTSGHGVRLVQPLVPPEKAASVLILGAGPIGLGALIFLKAHGYRNVHVSDPRSERLHMAQRLGATTLALDDESKRFPFIIESSGAHAARNRAITNVLPKGVVLLLGENDSPWSIEETKPIRRKDFFMVRSFYFPQGDLSANIELLRKYQQDYELLVDAEVGLADFAATFERFAKGELIKPLLAPNLA